MLFYIPFVFIQFLILKSLNSSELAVRADAIIVIIHHASKSQYPLGFTKPFVNWETNFAKCNRSGSLQ